MKDPQIQIASVGSVYVHMMTFEKVDDFIQGHAHTYDHVTLIGRGSVRYESNGRSTIYKAPHLVVVPRGVQHRLVALEDGTIACCLHALHAKDNPGDILDASMVPAGTPPWAFVVPLIEEHARRQGFVAAQTEQAPK